MALAASQSRQLVVLLFAVGCLLALCGSQAQAADYSEQKKLLRKVSTVSRAAERYARAGRNDDATEAFGKASEYLNEASKQLDERLTKQFERASETLSESYAELIAAGIKLPALSLPTAVAKPDADPGKAMGGRFAEGMVSFTQQVAPLLAAKCGRCHIDGEKGDLSLASYQNLMRGSRTAGMVLTPGEAVGSVLVESIASGDMPRGGGRVTPQELQMIIKWINEGAKFDGNDPAANLRDLKLGDGKMTKTPAEKMPSMSMAPKIRRSTGKESVSFAIDIAPILAEGRCVQCHIQQARGGLQMATYQMVSSAGIIVPGDPDKSPLVQRIRAEIRPRMPMGGRPLPDEQIEKIATWIREGATFDGELPTDPLPRVTLLARADRATSEELSEMRVGMAMRNWKIAIPDESAEAFDTDRFHVVGNLPSERLEAIGKQAETIADGVLKVFRQSDATLGKSRMTLFVVGKRLDYSEFGMMIERRELPPEIKAHARFDGVDSYACLLTKEEPQPNDQLFLAEQIAHLHLAERTKTRAPEWLIEGAALAAAAKVERKSETVAEWDKQLPQLALRLRSPSDFQTGRLAPPMAKVLRYGFAKAMLQNSKGFNQLLDEVAEGKDFTTAFKKQYRYSPEELATGWVGMLRRGGKR